MARFFIEKLFFSFSKVIYKLLKITSKWKFGCFQWFKDTNLKANHNWFVYDANIQWAVSNGSKILIWKQITTTPTDSIYTICCFQWFKDTNLKANHNLPFDVPTVTVAVSNGSKILIWKQITTGLRRSRGNSSCFQWFKDTNLKANHNNRVSLLAIYKLFPMVQRY